MLDILQQSNLSVEHLFQPLAAYFCQADYFHSHRAMIPIILSPEYLTGVSTSESILQTIRIILYFLPEDLLKRLRDLSVIVSHIIITYNGMCE